MNTKVEMAKLGIQFLILIVTAYLAPAAKDWLTQKSEDFREARVKEWAYKAVLSAEQIYKDYATKDPHGVKRKKHAREILRRINKRCGLCLTDDDIDALIEAAVQEFKVVGGSQNLTFLEAAEAEETAEGEGDEE